MLWMLVGGGECTVSHQPCFGYQVWKEQGVGVAAPLASFLQTSPKCSPLSQARSPCWQCGTAAATRPKQI